MAEPHRESERKGVANFKPGAEGVGAEEEHQIVLTVNSPMGKIVKIEKIDKAGKHQELAEEDWGKIVGEDEVGDFETAVEEAFEAGVAAALGEEYDEDDAYEDDEERAMRRVLLGGLLRRSVKRRILHRILVGRLLHRGTAKAATSIKAKSVSTQRSA